MEKGGFLIKLISHFEFLVLTFFPRSYFFVMVEKNNWKYSTAKFFSLSIFVPTMINWVKHMILLFKSRRIYKLLTSVKTKFNNCFSVCFFHFYLWSETWWKAHVRCWLLYFVCELNDFHFLFFFSCPIDGIFQ